MKSRKQILLSHLIIGLLISAAPSFSYAQGLFSFLKKPKHQYIELSVNDHQAYLLLFNQTPQHRDNFLNLVQQHQLDSTLFHRVINGFMIQGGDPTSKGAKKGQKLGGGDLGYTVPAEFRDSLFHKKGMLAAARDNNPEKASSASQFYIVQGKTFSDEDLDRIEENRLEGKKIPEFKRQVYKTLGGVPHLDGNYTIFGQVVKGLELIDMIAEVETDNNDRPFADQVMTVRILKNKEIRNLENELRADTALAKIIDNPDY
ncbi:peptidylprolyl isomerase [Olivibacter sitiensis]|uniref:peptidylprolyl isomerase n=1 Tax=Olivibacter sitiensis TaxID=376470 RepID=UPI0003F76E7B|nr:peptidylprolyl isomerase [Olivibacter sitiensis]